MERLATLQAGLAMLGSGGGGNAPRRAQRAAPRLADLRREKACFGQK